MRSILKWQRTAPTAESAHRQSGNSQRLGPKPPMTCRTINPIEYQEWDSLLLATDDHSFFHPSAWARVLHESYGYKPIYFTSFENGNLFFLMPFMEINSWLTGKRGVSLPFTDQCTPIISDGIIFERIVKDVIEYAQKAGWKYIEWRDGESCGEGVDKSEFYYKHELHLAKTEKELFSDFRDSTRRNIKKAGRSGVLAEISHSQDSIKSFYRLNCITRQRHGLPPQPFSFFKKIFEHVISKGLGFVVSAIHSGKVIASAVFFHFGKKAVYKYGAPDPMYQDLRPNNLVMWEAIKWCSKNGIHYISFGRTEPENKGLLQFKRGWGTIETRLHYYRYDLKKNCFFAGRSAPKNWYRIFKFMPTPMLRIVGDLLYRHVG